MYLIYNIRICNFNFVLHVLTSLRFKKKQSMENNITLFSLKTVRPGRQKQKQLRTCIT